jgi:selenide,water dikinase
MGADPKVALNLVAFPVGSIPLDVLRAILCGGADKAAAGGVAVTGGHSIIDRELKYGMTVSGFVHPDRILRNIGLRQGDALILTKPLGTGIAVTGVAKGVATDETAESALRTMTSLNRDAAMVLRNFEVHACCDVTGFGLLGHAAEMALGSKVTIALYSQALPVIPGVGDLIARRCVTSGCRRNMEYVRGKVNLDHLDERMVELLLDPQTSGGLLFGLPARSLDAVITQLKDQGVEAAAVIGEVEKAGKLPLRAI